MKQKGLPQECLKLIACVTMLLDHIGASLVPVMWLRIVGRLAFPIYCFLLAEGTRRTRNPRGYALRLGIGMILSEVPFDVLFFGGFTWQHQSVMVTLFLAFLMAMCMNRAGALWQKLLLILPFGLLAEFLSTDYGGLGVVMVALFVLFPRRPIVQTLGMAVLCWAMNSYRLTFGPVQIPIELFAVLSMVPILCYSGHKITHSRTVQWAFYLFYPCHLIALILVRSLL